jgi:hypothetical protein
MQVTGRLVDRYLMATSAFSRTLAILEVTIPRLQWKRLKAHGEARDRPLLVKAIGLTPWNYAFKQKRIWENREGEKSRAWYIESQGLRRRSSDRIRVRQAGLLCTYEASVLKIVLAALYIRKNLIRFRWNLTWIPTDKKEDYVWASVYTNTDHLARRLRTWSRLVSGLHCHLIR